MPERSKEKHDVFTVSLKFIMRVCLHVIGSLELESETKSCKTLIECLFSIENLIRLAAHLSAFILG